jgi:RNA polymerase sigma-70 factor, ECF subfamily
LSTDAEPIRRVALTGEFDRFRAQRPDRVELHGGLRNAVRAVPQIADLSDEDLVALVRAEDAEALDMLFVRHSRLVYSIAWRILRDSGEAEEVVQECFLYIFRKAFTFEPARGSVRVWIVQVAYSRARDRKAHLARRGYYMNLDIESDEVNGTLVGQDDLERKIGARLDFGRLQQAFGDLSEPQRQTLELFYFEGLEMREISERLEEPLGNVRHHFYRALERLRKSAIAARFRSRRDARN